ncbi:MAG TPA: hypothetical protein ENI27_10435, partial [bacterium]|nr:hypothetical protein [bacterium]
MGPAARNVGINIYKQSRLDALLWAYRDVGYFYANLNPLFADSAEARNFLYPQAKGAYEQLDLDRFNLTAADMGTVFSAGKAMKLRKAPLVKIIEVLEQTYCSSIGVEFLHIQNKPVRRWLINRMESTQNLIELSQPERRTVLDDLLKAEEFEHFLHTTFIGQKRFSLEGAEVLVPALHFMVNRAQQCGIREMVVGMTHRGRLTVLNQVLGKPPEEIFTEFEGGFESDTYGGSGDVKYHLGYSTDHKHPDGSSVHLSLVSNPSHLESVGAVVEGKVRGTQDKGR